MNDNLDVTLAPTIDLHTGYHGAILDSSIRSVSITARQATHVFLHDSNQSFSPHEHHHYGEFIVVGGSQDVVHSARWPVLGSRSWVADTDDLLYPILCGRTAHNPAFRAAIRDNSRPEIREALKRRAEIFMESYAHPSCLGILLRGHPRDCINDTREWLEIIGAQAREEFFEKIIPVRPSQGAMANAKFLEKWHLVDKELRITFCGRDFEYKNGHLALRAMRPLLDAHADLRFTYIGAIPEEVRQHEPELLRGIEHHERLNHQDVLSVLRDSHVFFHPSLGDSIGISLLEAMGAGLAVVVARGGAMEYTDELFVSGGALLLDRNRGQCDEVAGFRALLSNLVGDRGLALRLARHNLAATSTGEFSLDAQNARLATIYERSRRGRWPPLELSELSHISSLSVTEMNSQDVWGDMRAFRARTDEASGYKCILV